MLDKLSERISELRIQEKHLHPRIIQISSSVESLEQRISLVRKNYSDAEQTSVANELSFLNEKKSSLSSERSQIVKELSETEASISVWRTGKNLEERHFWMNRLLSLKIKLSWTPLLLNLRPRKIHLVKS